jgi:hypothetical protein
VTANPHISQRATEHRNPPAGALTGPTEPTAPPIAIQPSGDPAGKPAVHRGPDQKRSDQRCSESFTGPSTGSCSSPLTAS